MSQSGSRKLDLVPPDGRIINKHDYPELLVDYGEWAGGEFKIPEKSNFFPGQEPNPNSAKERGDDEGST